MRKKIVALVILVGAFVFYSYKNYQTIKQHTVTDYFNLVSDEFTGDTAYKTTAFVEQFWRVVGNEGFNKSIYKVAEELEEAGFVNEDVATDNTILTYRIEKRPLQRPTWEPVDATLQIDGETTPLLQHSTNRNMIALNSYSTPKEGVTGEVVYVQNTRKLKEIDVKGKIVFVESSPSRVFKQAVVEQGALGVLSYSNPKYLQPEKNTTSIQFRFIPLDKNTKGWAIAMSYQAKERLKAKLSEGKVHLKVNISTKIYPSEELTIVADIKGYTLPEERLVFSAHVQEPGANDNASGVGVALEMAMVTAKLVKEGKLQPKRTLTFLWGDEIVSTGRYVKDNEERAKNIKWGISLDMVGENTAITGGTFLIEKMPDPSAVWTRGNDKHSEWGGRPMTLKEMKPHYLNDFVIRIFKEQGKRANWEVNTNPYEGGSDHVPFLRGNIPSVLFWHFTDQFYHTDNDRLDKVSQTTLANVGTASLVSAYTLLNADEHTAKKVIVDIEKAAIARLNEELKQGKIALAKGETLEKQENIINAWKDWYIQALTTTQDMAGNVSSIQKEIDNASKNITKAAKEATIELKKN